MSSRPTRKALSPRTTPCAEAAVGLHSSLAKTVAEEHHHHKVQPINHTSLIDFPYHSLFTCFGPSGDAYRAAPVLYKSPRHPIKRNVVLDMQAEQQRLKDIMEMTQALPPPSPSRYILPVSVHSTMAGTMESAEAATPREGTAREVHGIIDHEKTLHSEWRPSAAGKRPSTLSASNQVEAGAPSKVFPRALDLTFGTSWSYLPPLFDRNSPRKPPAKRHLIAVTADGGKLHGHGKTHRRQSQALSEEGGVSDLESERK